MPIGHLINKEMLEICYREMDKNKAVGIDGVSKEMYEENLDENLERLVKALKNKSYKPQPVKRVHIPKGNGKTRPLGIAVYMRINSFSRHLRKYWKQYLNRDSGIACLDFDRAGVAMML